MSGGARIGLLVATAAAIVLAFVLLSPGGDDEPRTAGPATTAAPPPAAPAPATATTEEPPAPPPPPAPAFTTIRVEGGKPEGGVRTITLKKGERARIAISSPDTSDEVHVHGYDLKRDLKAGGSVRLSFPAEAEGIFEIELEGAGTQIGKLVVEP